MSDSSFKKIKEKDIVIKDDLTGYDKTIRQKTFKLPNGTLESFFIDVAKDSVQIFPITSENEVLLVQQFRPGDEKEWLELPGGGKEDDETVLDEVAARELVEETGYKGKMKYLGSVPYSPYTTGTKHMFLATDCIKVSKLDLDPNEFLVVKKVSMDTFMTLLRQSKIRGTDTAFLGLDKLKV
jgi:ADP-ribose pyrophosphatase